MTDAGRIIDLKRKIAHLRESYVGSEAVAWANTLQHELNRLQAHHIGDATDMIAPPAETTIAKWMGINDPGFYNELRSTGTGSR